MCLYLHTKFQVSSITLTSFEQRRLDNFTLPPPQNKPLKSPPILGFIMGLGSKSVFNWSNTLHFLNKIKRLRIKTFAERIYYALTKTPQTS